MMRIVDLENRIENPSIDFLVAEIVDDSSLVVVRYKEKDVGYSDSVLLDMGKGTFVDHLENQSLDESLQSSATEVLDVILEEWTPDQEREAINTFVSEKAQTIDSLKKLAKSVPNESWSRFSTSASSLLLNQFTFVEPDRTGGTTDENTIREARNKFDVIQNENRRRSGLWNTTQIEEFEQWFLAPDTRELPEIRRRLLEIPSGSRSVVRVRLSVKLNDRQNELLPKVANLSAGESPVPWVATRDKLEQWDLLEKKEKLLREVLNYV